MNERTENGDGRLYRQMAYALAELRCRETVEAHADCPGCDLCIDARGMAYTLAMYASLIDSAAPCHAAVQARRDLDRAKRRRCPKRLHRIA
jgi:hypothetical protein